MQTTQKQPESAGAVSSTRLLDDAIELLSVAFIRGDDDLPHPADDPKLWSARMQTAWNRLRCTVEMEAPGKLEAAHIELRAMEYDALHSSNVGAETSADRDSQQPETL